MKKKLLIIVGGVFVVVIVAPLLTYGVWQYQARRAVEALDMSGQSLHDPDMLGVDEEHVNGIAEDEAARGPAQRPDASGTLRIDEHNIEMPVFRGSRANLLYWGAWKPVGGADPGEVGNAVIFGHRWLKLPPSRNTMWHLDKVQEGDSIEVEWNGEIFTYLVRSTAVVTPDDVSVLGARTDSTLTLVTCTPVFSVKDRLVVTAELVQ